MQRERVEERPVAHLPMELVEVPAHGLGMGHGRRGVAVRECEEIVAGRAEHSHQACKRPLDRGVGHFPGGEGEWKFKQDDLQGVFSIRPEASENRPGLTLLWRDASDIGGPAAMATVSLGKSDKTLAFTWNNAQPPRAKRRFFFATV